LLAFIANNPTASGEDVFLKAKSMGYSPMDLIDASLGSVKYDKSGASLDKPLEDILNEVYEKDPTPGRRYVIDPKQVTSKKGKDVLSYLDDDLLGVATSLNTGRERSLPDFIGVRDQSKELEKLKAITHAGHELKHQEDYLIRPNLKMTTPDPYKKGHHFKEVYEPYELIREAKDLPKDEKVVKEILKQSKKAGLKPLPFSRLRSVLGPLGGILGAAGAMQSGDAMSAGLELGSTVDPTGVLDAAAEVNRRLKMPAKEAMKESKEDFYSAMPMDIANEQRMLDELDVEKEIGKRKQKLGYK
jgi:hypothetical protein